MLVQLLGVAPGLSTSGFSVPNTKPTSAWVMFKPMALALPPPTPAKAWVTWAPIVSKSMRVDFLSPKTSSPSRF